MTLKAKIRRTRDDIELPVQASIDDVGYDIRASESIEILKDQLVFIPTGLIVEPPPHYNFEVRLRSSVPKKHGLLIPHGMGTIDPGYCGEGDEIRIPVYKFGEGTKDSTINFLIGGHGGKITLVKRGDRVAQLILVKTNYFSWEDATGTSFSNKTRGGFGSTGSD